MRGPMMDPGVPGRAGHNGGSHWDKGGPVSGGGNGGAVQGLTGGGTGSAGRGEMTIQGM